MTNNIFKNVINELLVPYGFKKNRNNSWTRKGKEVSMKVYLQKSNFSNLYYFRSSYILDNMQVESTGDNECFSDLEFCDYKLLSKMCDLEFDVSDEERIKYLRELITKDFANHRYIETEAELKKVIKQKKYTSISSVKEIFRYRVMKKETY